MFQVYCTAISKVIYLASNKTELKPQMSLNFALTHMVRV